MDYPDFLILRLRGPGDFFAIPEAAREEEILVPKEIKLPFFLRFIAYIMKGPGRSGRVAERMKYRWLKWRLPLLECPVFCMDRQGEEVFLPFSKEEMRAYTKAEITDMLHRIIVEKGVQNMVVDTALEPFLEKGLCIDGGMIPILMSDEIIKHICKKHQMARRELKPVVMAAGQQETFYVLKKLGKDLNRLTIVSDEPEVYEDFVRMSYEEQGLLVRIVERPVTRELYGNLILELSPRYRKDHNYYPEGSVVLNFTDNPYQIQDILMKRRNLICYNRFDIRMLDGIWDNRILQAVIYGTNSRIGAGQLQKGEKIKEIYGFKVEKAGIKY